MDITTLIGIIVCAAFVFLGIVSGNEGFAALGHFGDTVSVFITIGGSVCCMLMQAKSIPEFIASFKSFGLAFKVQNTNEAEVIGNIVNLSNVARKEGLLALEEMANNIEDEFLKKGIM